LSRASPTRVDADEDQDEHEAGDRNHVQPAEAGDRRVVAEPELELDDVRDEVPERRARPEELSPKPKNSTVASISTIWPTSAVAADDDGTARVRQQVPGDGMRRSDAAECARRVDELVRTQSRDVRAHDAGDPPPT